VVVALRQEYPALLMAAIATAAQLIKAAPRLLFTVGAGMGVDSGFPDFRGTDGFWRAYPPFAKLGLAFEDLASPDRFDADPTLAWGFYAHRLQMYRRTAPHAGYGAMQRWRDELGKDIFVYTSNVDGAFQRCGFADRLMECHGTGTLLQCTNGRCASRSGTFDAAAAVDAAVIDEETMRVSEATLPLCPRCSRAARPNILMWGDFGFLDGGVAAQEKAFQAWLKQHEDPAAPPPVIVEVGAGTSGASVRGFTQLMRDNHGAAPVVRINAREADVDGANCVAVEGGARDALLAIDALLR
jgi:NAD-dependent SIR2 family protein deacetylase